MLVLTRKLNETIMIADCIQITVIEFHFNKVKLGINAPISIPILREELYIREKIKKANDNQGHMVLDKSKCFIRV